LKGKISIIIKEIIKKLLQDIKDADMVLVGIGDELQEKYAELFENHANDDKVNTDENANTVNKSEQFFIDKIMKEIQNTDNYNFQTEFQKMEILNKKTDSEIEIVNAYNVLAEVLKEKNYFIVTLNTDGYIEKSILDSERIVEPCGNYNYMQCSNRCSDTLYKTMEILKKHSIEDSKQSDKTILCEKCGKPIIFNNIQAEKYIEDRYLPMWGKYTEWIQSTLNKKLIILELGVGLQFPNVIRWPFERVALINKKAKFYRVHSNLCQLSEDLSEKGIGIETVPVQFLLNDINKSIPNEIV